MGRFCKTHIGERTEQELREELLNQTQLKRVYASDSPSQGKIDERVKRIREELRKKGLVVTS